MPVLIGSSRVYTHSVYFLCPVHIREWEGDKESERASEREKEENIYIYSLVVLLLE